MAQALAKAGADVIAASSQQSSDGGEVGEVVRGLGRRFEGYAVDFADRDAVREFGESVPHADILVNNAGTVRRAPAIDYPIDWWEEVVQVNLSSQHVLSQLLGRKMLGRGEGRIIFTASLLSFQGGVNAVSYAAAKSGLAGLIRALSNEWAASGVTVNGIAPGYITTDITRELRDDPERSRAILDRIPAGRWGRPEDIGAAAVFLASPAAAYITGTILPVDGGWLAR